MPLARTAPGACQMTFGGRISQTPIGDAVRHTNQLKGNNDHALPPIPFHTPKFTSVGAWLEATNLPWLQKAHEVSS